MARTSGRSWRLLYSGLPAALRLGFQWHHRQGGLVASGRRGIRPV